MRKLLQPFLSKKKNITEVLSVQILGVNESPSSIIFCQAILTSPNLPDRSGDMYSEVFEIDLTRGLKTCREMFNSSTRMQKCYCLFLELSFSFLELVRLN